jgi:alpha-1,4-digalacturonate transport system substrate-binding protein
MMWYDDGNEGEVMRGLLDRFEAENPNITVVMDTVAYKDLHNILQAQVEAGSPPDMGRVTDVSRFRGQYLDMRPYMSDANGWAANWPEAVLGSMRAEGDTAGLHGFPTQFTITGPYINRTLFEQAGVAVPSDSSDEVTWDEWVEAAEQVAEATGTPYAVAIDRTGHRFWGPSLSQCATYLNDDGTFTVDTPGFRDTAQMIIDWHSEGITPLEVWAGGGGGYAAANEFFVNAQLVLYMSGSWQVGQFANLIGDTFDWEVIPNPCGDCGCTGIPGGAVLTAFAGTEHPEEVAKVMEFLSQEDILGEFSAESLFIPGHLGLAEKGIEYPSNNEPLNMFLSQIPKLMPEAYALQYHPLTFVLNTEIRDRLSQVIVGEITLDEAIEKIQEKMDEAVSE